MSQNTPEMSYEEHAIAKLRSAGYRITMPRVQVIRALGEADQALGVYQIHERILASKGKIDVVSVYRILYTFQEPNVGVVRHIGLVDGYVKYQTPKGQGSVFLVDLETKEVHTYPSGSLLDGVAQTLVEAGVDVDKLDLGSLNVEIPLKKGQHL